MRGATSASRGRRPRPPADECRFRRPAAYARRLQPGSGRHAQRLPKVVAERAGALRRGCGEWAKAHFARPGRSTGRVGRLEKSEIGTGWASGSRAGADIFEGDEGRIDRRQALKRSNTSTCPARSAASRSREAPQAHRRRTLRLHLRRVHQALQTTSSRRRKENTTREEGKTQVFPAPPRDQGVPGTTTSSAQGHGKKALAVAVYKPRQAHLSEEAGRRGPARREGPGPGGRGAAKANICIFGPPEYGKTLLGPVRLARFSESPLNIAEDATSLTEAGGTWARTWRKSSRTSSTNAGLRTCVEKAAAASSTREIDKIARPRATCVGDTRWAGGVAAGAASRFNRGHPRQRHPARGERSNNSRSTCKGSDTTNILFICGGASRRGTPDTAAGG